MLDDATDDGLYLSSNADGCLASVFLRDPELDEIGAVMREADLVDGGVNVSDGAGRFDRDTRAALDARMRGLRGGFEDVDDRRTGVECSDRGEPSMAANLVNVDPTFIFSYSCTIVPFSPFPSLFPPALLVLDRATILARILASLAANTAGSYPSQSFPCVAE